MNSRIKELRQQLGLSQDEFGARLGVTNAAISRLESGARSVTEQMALAMHREFGASYSWLTTGDGPMFDNGEEAVLHAMVDRVMASENERVKQIFKNLGDFTEDDWRQVNAVLDKLLAGMRPWEDEKKD